MQTADNDEAGNLLSPVMQNLLKAASCGELWVKGTLARVEAWSVAEAASRGWLTTQVGLREYSNRWRLTPSGSAILSLELGIL